MRNLSVLLLAIAASSFAEGSDTLVFRNLFNGKDLSGWVDVNTSPETWRVEDTKTIEDAKALLADL